MRFDVPERLLNQLRARREERLHTESLDHEPICPCIPEGRERNSRAERDCDGFLLWGDHFLTSDGQVLALEEGAHGEPRLREASDSEAFAAIVYAAQLGEADPSGLSGVTGLLDLLPQADPETTETCAGCAGSRFNWRGYICDTCHGLGWRPRIPTASDRVEQILRALFFGIRS